MSDALPETVDFVILTALEEGAMRSTPYSQASDAPLRAAVDSRVYFRARPAR